MNSTVPNIVVEQGDVEDWIIENRSQELHDFHIHQVHYLMLEWNGQKTNEPFLRDTINVPYWDGKSPRLTPASNCGSIFAIRISSEPFPTIAIFWSTKTAA